MQPVAQCPNGSYYRCITFVYKYYKQTESSTTGLHSNSYTLVLFLVRLG